jgi:hypothetical protein
VTGVAARKSALTRLGQLAALALVFGAYYAAAQMRTDGGGSAVAATGFLLLSGMLMSELFEIVKLPHLTGYIAAGVLAGPHVLHFIEHDAVRSLELVNTLALALIALAGGLELRVADVRAVAKGVAYTRPPWPFSRRPAPRARSRASRSPS